MRTSESSSTKLKRQPNKQSRPWRISKNKPVSGAAKDMTTRSESRGRWQAYVSMRLCLNSCPGFSRLRTTQSRSFICLYSTIKMSLRIWRPMSRGYGLSPLSLKRLSRNWYSLKGRYLWLRLSDSIRRMSFTLGLPAHRSLWEQFRPTSMKARSQTLTLQRSMP